MAYSERLRVPWWAPPAALAVMVLLGAEVHLGNGGLRAWLPYVVLVGGAGWALWWLGRIRIAVTDGELWVDDAHIPLRFLAEPQALDATAKRAALGPELDPLAFVVHRGWVPTAVRVFVDDPDDPTPYWVVSTRRPAALIAALTASAVPPAAAPDRPAPTSPG